ncbi:MULTISPECIES: ATP-grasp fold amidoligase family protein [Bacillaceae]|uniref:ATP-grasp fold amidoligase family protein n=1 Tax=Bacillaceae TaxID=186817 RepID=UPI001F15CFB4|nr:ATP-grasp fold amidoligase family protein [Litchfieldia alkalitelluris]
MNRFHDSNTSSDGNVEILVSDIMKKEVELKELQRENLKTKKEIKKLATSRKWKYSRPLRKWLVRQQSFLSRLSSKKYTELSTENVSLRAEVIGLKQELATIQTKHYQEVTRLKKILDRETDLSKDLKQTKKDGTFFEKLDWLIQAKQMNDKQYNASLKYAAKLFKHDREDYKVLAYKKVLKTLNLEEIPEFIVREVEHSPEIEIAEAASFSASLTTRAIQKYLGGNLPEWILDDKVLAYKFIDTLGIKRPWFSEDIFQYNTIEKQKNIVIKPLNGAGSRGVYLVFNESKIYDIKRSKILNSWEELTANMKEDIEAGWVQDDEWMIEELLLENKNSQVPARDLKFYCFYGKVGLVLEIERHPKLRYCWWTPSGEMIKTGKYDNELFTGKGFRESDLELAESLSSKVPAPFIRIDFLKTEDGLYFGEFTPKPGNYDEFDDKTDKFLGLLYLDADSRLNFDLFKGKQFKSYKTTI